MTANPANSDVARTLDFTSRIKSEIAELTDPDLALPDVSLTNCDREPIHIPSAIQPHGVLIAFEEDSFCIQQVSQNISDWFGLSPTALLGQPLSTLLSEDQLAKVQGCLANEFEHVNPLRFQLDAQLLEGTLHRTDGAVVLELEPVEDSEDVNFFDFYRCVKEPLDRIQSTQTLAELCQAVTQEIHRITGFDRVMVYRFATDGSGSVIAETVGTEHSPYLGLHYPSTDIPKQAKQLYRLNRLRIVPDVTYQPVALEPAHYPSTGKPLDMSLSLLRSVSPIHIEYLKNMGVRASMSVSLLYQEKLWGLIACHHYTPMRLSQAKRTICEFIGQVLSAELVHKLEAEDRDYRLKLQTIQSRFVDSIAQHSILQQGLHQNPTDLMQLVGATGAAFCEEAQITTYGNTPPKEVIQTLLDELKPEFETDSVWYSHALGKGYPDLQPYKDIASGALALCISRAQDIYLLWFRPEVLQTVSWGGEPSKPTVTGEDGLAMLSPRQSFALWQETVQLQSLPWKTCEIDAALELRSAIIGIVLRKADELAQLNFELERSNIELDSFAYVASHDLKEPLRGIHNYSSFLLEDYGDQLDADGQDKLQTLMRLTERMENLISSLLHYSRLGRAELRFTPVQLNEVVASVIDVIKISQSSAVEFVIPRELPTVEGDRTLIMELFTNLMSNAVKYNEQADKRIEIGFLHPDEAAGDLPLPPMFQGERSGTLLYVKDNGIGIREKHLENVFKIFKRLHAPGRYGGGTGAGLTITKKIVERHGGQIAVYSEYGHGSTFYFNLGHHAAGITDDLGR